MLDSWNVFYKLEYIGILTYNTDTKYFTFEYKGNSDKAYEIYKYLNGDKDKDWLRETIFDRVFPPERVDARQLLAEMGLPKYDAWEIVKKCRLTSVNDLVWMTKGTDPMEFYDVHILGDICREEDFPDK